MHVKHIITCSPGLPELAAEGAPTPQLQWKSQGAQFFGD